MKTLIKIFTGAFLGLALIAISSCNCIEGKGDVVTQTRQIESFNAINLDFPAQVYLVQDSVQKIKIEGQQNILDIIKTEVSGNKLTIKSGKRCINNDKGVIIYISVPALEKIVINGSGNIETKSTIKTERMEVSLNGSGDITMNLETDKLDAELSGSGNFIFKGTVKEEELTINGSGSINAMEFPGSDCKIDINGSGSCQVMALKTLKVGISGSGNVTYKGSPEIKSRISGSGSVNKAD